MKTENGLKSVNDEIQATDGTEIRELTVADLESVGGGNHVTLSPGGPANQ